MSETERLLPGGRTTIGVVQVGNTVRRPGKPNSGFVRGVLLHLEAVGFGGVPRHLGVDEVGREVFRYLAGDVPADLGHHDDPVLEGAACLIRRYHDATASFVRSGSAEVVCHNDLSPCNTVFQDGRPIALIDFDAASPGTRAHDLGYAAWLWLDIGNADKGAVEQRRRLRVFLAAYGPTPEEAEVIDAMLDRQSLLISDAERTGNAAMRQWAMECRHWTVDHLLALPQPP